MSGPAKPKPPEGLVETSLLDLEIAWQERLEEAETLEKADFHSTAASLRLYALEVLVKVVICKHLGLAQLPSVCKTHDLSSLIIHTGRWKDLQGISPTLLRFNWDILVNYSRTRLNELRYQPRSALTASDSSKIKEALNGPEDDAESGVLTWLSKHI